MPRLRLAPGMNQDVVGVLVDRAALAKVRGLAGRSRFEMETGGVLVGCRRGGYLHVTDASAPQASDRASPFRFWRSPQGHQAFAEAAWRKSRGHVSYIGEWHSHPEDEPSPSSIDRQSWATTFASHQRPLVFVIVGRQGLWLSVQSSSASAKALIVREDDGTGQLFS
ncbi:hypothetical protein SGCZBJ_20375 [Caulobacter zeae]|uniref:JAB domain-containing protein n=2 Tax=Caulobacter zeae TaxID=2055137 RepID=A0A2N5D772_9CAUL|nr:hypothetical protein SGCZBJ_20375 [Caulobacter zeae]